MVERIARRAGEKERTKEGGEEAPGSGNNSRSGSRGNQAQVRRDAWQPPGKMSKRKMTEKATQREGRLRITCVCSSVPLFSVVVLFYCPRDKNSCSPWLDVLMLRHGLRAAESLPSLFWHSCRVALPGGGNAWCEGAATRQSRRLLPNSQRKPFWGVHQGRPNSACYIGPSVQKA